MKKLMNCLNNLTPKEQKQFLIYFFAPIVILSIPLIFVRLEFDYHLYLVPVLLIGFLMSFNALGIFEKMLEKHYDKARLMVFLAVPVLTAFLAAPSFEIFNLFNLLIIAVPYFILFIIFRNTLACTIPVTVLCYLLHLTNEILILIRGTGFSVSDFLALKTAMTVASNYELRITQNMYYPLLGTVLILTLAVIFNFSFKKSDNKKIKAASQISSAVMLVVSAVFIVTEINGDKRTYDFNDHNSNTYEGICYTMFRGIIDSYLEPPDGYTNQIVNQIIEEYEVTEGSRTPNIIVIMNESFADISQVYDLDKQECMPFIESLNENIIKGKTVVSCYGGGTCNSEYEFLTGMTMEFLPDGSFPYMQYIKNDINTLYSELDPSLYSNKYIHPYIASNWNRSSIFTFLGFDEFIDGLAFSTQDTYKEQYSQRNNFIDYEGVEQVRGYIGDGVTYKKVIELYENKPENSRISQFVVTMQNHSPYNYSGEDFIVDVISGLDKPDIDQYLSLVKISDQEIQKLIEYFSGVQEDTVICFFGDHFPYLETDEPDISLNQNKEYVLNHFSTPFFIWTNYESDTEYIDYVSLNYLSLLLKEKAGLPLTQFDGFRKELYQKYPVFSTKIIIDSSGNCYYGSSQINDILVKEYEYIQYHNLFG